MPYLYEFKPINLYNEMINFGKIITRLNKFVENSYIKTTFYLEVINQQK